MLKKSVLFGLMGVVLVGSFSVAATEEKSQATEDPRTAIIKALFDLGEGCKTVLDPKTKEIKGIFVIGTASITKSMRAADALKRARRDAMIDAQKEFSKYLNSSVMTSFNEQTQEVTLIEGSSSGEQSGSSTEQTAKLTENKELFNRVSQSVQSGMEKEGEKREDGTLIAVYSWEPAKCAALKKAAKTMGDTADESVRQSNRVQQSRDSGTAAADTPAEDNKSTQEAASGNADNNVASDKNAPVKNKTSVAPDVSGAF